MDLRSLVEPFVGPVSQATFAFPVAAFLLAVPFALWHYRRHGQVHPWRALVGYSFVYYLIAAFFLVILPLPELPARGADLAAWNDAYGGLRRPVLDPTHVFREILASRATWRFSRELYQAIFNFLLLLPFGAYLVYAFRRRIIVAAALGLALSLFFETCQLTGNFWIYPGPYRLFDAGDLLLNTAGTLTGALLAALLVSFRALPDAAALEGPKLPWIGPFRRSIALFFDALATALTFILASLFSDRVLGLDPAISARFYPSASALFWLVLLPAFDRGRGLGKGLTLCAVQREKGVQAGFFRILARQAAIWALPALAWAVADRFPSSGPLSLVLPALLIAWFLLWAINAGQASFGADHAGWLDRRLGTRVRNTWKEGAPPAAGLLRAAARKAGASPARKKARRSR